ncbi:MAG: HD domain-containing protein, partial [Quisquiliibacterium sp.]
MDSSLGPAQVAERIVQFFEFLASRPDRAVLAQSMAMKSLGIAGSDPVLKAGAEIAQKLDAGIGSGVAHGYHNTKHFIETMLCALYLCQATGLSQSRSCRIVTAALAHDLHHDGTRGSMSPFRLETASAQHADHELKLAGCSDEQRKQIFALILATEPSQGVPYARGCLHASEAGTHA